MPRTLGPTLLIVAFTLVSLSTCIVALRLYCRYFRTGAVKIDDYLMVAALLLTWGIAAINSFQVQYGTGTRTEDQDMENGLSLLEGTLKSWYVYQIVYLVTLCVVKLSILSFYRMLSSQRIYRIVIYGAMGVVITFTIAMVFVNAFECPNPSDAWSIEILFQGDGSCHDLHPIYYGQASFNIFSDLFILLLPMPMLRRLHMKRNKRFALIAIFSVGSLAVLASAVRVYALTLWSAVDADIPYQGANILIWSQVEINIAIISASIPSLKPLLRRTFPTTTVAHTYAYGRKGGYVTSFSEQRSNANVVELKGLASPSSPRPRHDSDSDEQLLFQNTSVTSPGGQSQQKPSLGMLSHRPFETSNNNNSESRQPTSGIHVSQSVEIETRSRTEDDIQFGHSVSSPSSQRLDW
ncbi:hypothetical protein AJ80_02231 [Polytolypa hystricis UAMH7299]|uniref:Rhodopsin domain-containing protein n=1 Tax=Polytolypa hystricis (strain UAMH7299) TaxID=1447883 RepID=A0A2B7YQN6_POLH7|nr:hypothetical protein AJ80_02231 [Polytolypa hystricis UAMH7299]